MIETYEQSNQGKVIAAFAQALADMPKVQKTGFNPHFKANFANIETILPIVKDVLDKNGLMLVQRPNNDKSCAVISGELIHIKSCQSLDLGTVSVPIIKNDPQAYGSAMTYARRYLIVTTFLIETGDDDGQSASKPEDKDNILSVKVRIAKLAGNLGFTEREAVGSIANSVRRHLDVAEDVEGLLLAEKFIKSSLTKANIDGFLNDGVLK